MNLAHIDTVAKLETLRAAEGFGTVDAMLEPAAFDSASPAVCIDCDHTSEMEPDQDRGYCENCGQNTVVSALILAGII